MEQNAAPATEPAASRKVFIKTYGCQMNVYDSQRMADQLTAEGYAGTEILEDADLVLINTCHIREKAAEKVYSELGRIREIKKAKKAEGRDMLLGVTGCVAQAEGAEILRREKAVDMVIGPQTYHRLPSILRRVGAGERVIDNDHAVEDKFDHLANPDRKAVQSARRHGLCHHPGRLRQILLLLRGALHTRRGSLAVRGAGSGRSRAPRIDGRARSHTLGTERQCMAGQGGERR